MTKFKSIVREFEDSRLYSHYFDVPAKNLDELNPKDRRVICTINDKVSKQVGLYSHGDGSYFVNLNKELRKKLALATGDVVTVELALDESEYGIFVPEVFTELCKQDALGSKYFHQLTKGKQRSLLHIMGKPKSEEKQMEKTIIIFEYLKNTKGNLDFKELNEAFKTYRK